MCAKIKLRLDKSTDNKFIKIPLFLESNLSGQDEIVNREFVNVEVDNAINPIVDYETVRFTPITSSDGNVNSLTLKLTFLDNDGNLSGTTYGDIGMLDDDIKYRKSRFLNSFLRMNFYDSDITTNQNLMSQITVFSKVTNNDIVDNTSVRGSGTGDVDNDGGATSVFSSTGIITADCNSGMNGVINTGSSPVIITNESVYYSGFPVFEIGAFVTINGSDVIYDGESMTLQPNTTYTFTSTPVYCVFGSGTATLVMRDSSGNILVNNPPVTTSTTTTSSLSVVGSSGLPLNANNFPVRFILTNPITNPLGFSEGFYIYHFKGEVLKDAVLPKYLYMRAEFNNASTGKTTRFITTTDVLPIDLLMSKLHVRYLLTRTSTGYYYKIDNTYNNSTNVIESGLDVTLNLYEIQVE